MWKEQQKELESDNQDNSNNMSREPLRFSSPSLTPYAEKKEKKNITPNRQVQKTDNLARSEFFGPLLLHYAGDHADLVCVYL